MSSRSAKKSSLTKKNNNRLSSNLIRAYIILPVSPTVILVL